MSSHDDDLRMKILRADVLAREGHFSEAIALYDSVAIAYANLGFALRSIALLRLIVQVVDESAPQLSSARSVALCRLVDLYGHLGMKTQADETRRMLD